MASFDIAYVLTHNSERGYANHKSDAGGETWNGIARRYHPDWSGWLILDKYKDKDNLPLSVVDKLKPLEKEFYLVNFWWPISGPFIEDQEVANLLYDIAVNGGTERAARYLQHNLNLLNRRGRDYPDIVVDEDIGPKTLKALNAHLDKRGRNLIMLSIASSMIEHWKKRAFDIESQEDFLNGILNRWKNNIVGLFRRNTNA